jgi:hypothetical protein
MKFSPTIAEVLEAIEKQEHAWADRWEWASIEGNKTIDECIEYWEKDLTEAIATGTARLEAAERQRIEQEGLAKRQEEVRVARLKEFRAMQVQEREARLAKEAKEREEREARLAKEREERRERNRLEMEQIWATLNARREGECLARWAWLWLFARGIYFPPF